MPDLEGLRSAVFKGDMAGAEQAIREALDKGVPAPKVLNQGLVPAMEAVGQAMKDGEYFIPEVLLSSRAFGAAIAILQPFLGEEALGLSRGKVVLGTMKGDLHDIGKNLVAVMLRGAGFDIIDLGTDVPPERFVQAVQEANADVLGLSALITTTMVGMSDVIRCLEGNNWRNRVKVIIGGAPVTDRFAEEIGADGYSPDAAGAIDLVRGLLNRNST